MRDLNSGAVRLATALDGATFDVLSNPDSMAPRAAERSAGVTVKVSNWKEESGDAMDAVVREAVLAHREGRYDEALRILERLFAQIDSRALPILGNHFITMFEWSLLVEDYPPAREALTRTRDEQVQRLRAGEVDFGDGSGVLPSSRFHVIVEMNDILGDKKSTYELFVHLISFLPALARREAFLAMPAVVDVGDFKLAEGYLGDPLTWLDELNRQASEFPLYPPRHAAPRLAAELSNFMNEVILRGAVLRGLGRENEADLLRNAALDGLATDEMRELGLREIAVRGSINREIAARRMALEDAPHPINT